MNKQTYTIKKIYIKKQKDIYNHRTKLMELGIKWDSKKEYYTNPYDISVTAMEEADWLCKKNDFKYEIKIEQYEDYENRVANIYQLKNIDESTFCVVNRKDNKKIFIIHIYTKIEYDIISILDTVNGLAIKLQTKIKEKSNILVNIFDLMQKKSKDIKDSNKDFNLDNLIFILSILLEEYNHKLSKDGKLLRFKYSIIEELEKKYGVDSFLCNCIDGFSPETKFYLLNKRIISSFNNNYVSAYQEKKIWNYLYINRECIGVDKEPTLNQLFIGQKIKVVIDSFETELPITKIIGNDSNIEITVFNGSNNQKLNKFFNKEELKKRIRECR